jgi:hypothetical protein
MAPQPQQRVVACSLPASWSRSAVRGQPGDPAGGVVLVADGLAVGAGHLRQAAEVVIVVADDFAASGDCLRQSGQVVGVDDVVGISRQVLGRQCAPRTGNTLARPTAIKELENRSVFLAVLRSAEPAGWPVGDLQEPYSIQDRPGLLVHRWRRLSRGRRGGVRFGSPLTPPRRRQERSLSPRGRSSAKEWRSYVRQFHGQRCGGRQKRDITRQL